MKIGELKSQLNSSAQVPEPVSKPRQEQYRGPELLFGQQIHATREEIMAALPPRSEADELIIAYFSSMDMAPGLDIRLPWHPNTADHM